MTRCVKKNKELEDTSGIVLVEYIRSNVEILLNIKSEGDSFSEQEKSLAYPEFFSHASSILSKNSKVNTEGYEKMIQKLEGDIRNHIRSEQQLKLYCENLLEKLDMKKEEFAELRKKTKDKLLQVKKDKKRMEELLSVKEKDIIGLKTDILQFEEKMLATQQELVDYKRETEAKIVTLQSRYSQELSNIKNEKRRAIEEVTK